MAPPTDEYEVVAYRPGVDDEAIARFQSGLWGRDRDTHLAYLRWKYLENPYLTYPLIQLVRHHGEVVAMRGMFGTCWAAGAERTRWTLPTGGDTLIRRDHQSRGLFRLLNLALMRELAERGHPLALNLSAGPATSLRSQRCGWRLVPRFERVRRPADGILKALVPRSTSGTRATDTIDPSAFLEASRAHRATMSPRDQRRTRHVRDAEYLAWRFRNPMSRYTFIHTDPDPSLGCIVLQTSMDEQPERTNILEWVARDEAVAARLLAAALAKARGTAMVALGGPLSMTFPSLLHGEGFRPFRPARSERFVEGVLLAWTDLATDPVWSLEGVTTDPRSWDVRMLDSDQG